MITPHVQKNRGQLLFSVLVFAVVGTLFLTGLVGWAGINMKALRSAGDRELAFHIAEAGIDYYRWHLAHAPADYRDGTATSGPYIHSFNNAAGEEIGSFTLDITAPQAGSTIVTVTSTGATLAEPLVTRTIRARLAIPSFARFAWVLNSFVNFGSTAEVFGPIHSNAGLRFDGIAHNLVTSATSTFDDPDHSGGVEFGVHTHDSPTDPLPPAAVPTRADVFEAGRLFPVHAVDFKGIISDLSQIKTDAQASGRYIANSGSLGYHIVLRTNDTFDLYRVTNLYSQSGCSCTGTGCTTMSIRPSNGQTFIANYAFPSNGLIFVEDHVWVDGTINGARLTIASARFPDNPSTRTSIIVNNDLRYTNYDGTDVIGLIAQNNFNVGLRSENDLRIDAAVIAQNGRVGRFSYDTSCTDDTRDLLTTYGMLATNQRSAFWYGTNGYIARDYIYDANLLYAPPPSFPLTSDQYTTISWEEIEE